MRRDAFLNGQNFHNFFLTSPDMQFTKSGFPVVSPLLELPRITRFLPFNYVLNTDCSNKGVTFYIQDYLFDRVWNNPTKYVEPLKKCGLVTGPDFSLLYDTPYPIQMWNCYRIRWLEAYWQANGITVVPNITWSDRQSYSWCFDGAPRGSIISISAVGCMKELQSTELFISGYRRAQEILKPKLIILHCAKGAVEKIRKHSFYPVRFVCYSLINGN